MNIFDEGLFVMRSLLAYGDLVARQAGSKWEGVRGALLSGLTELAAAPDDELEDRLTLVLDLLQQDPVAEVTGPLMIQARALARKHDHTATVEFFSPEGDDVRVVRPFKMALYPKPDWRATLRSAAGATADVVEATESGFLAPTVAIGADGVTIVVPDPTDAQFSPEGIDESERHLNAGFFEVDEDVLIHPSEALSRDHGPYRLGVNVGAFWGPGTAGERFPDAVLESEFELQEHLRCQVVPFSKAVGVHPDKKPLRLPRTGDSPMVYFDVELGDPGRHLLNVHLLYRGSLLQSRQLVFDIVNGYGQRPPERRHPAQDGFVIFTRSRELSHEAVSETQPRVVTVLVQRVPAPQADLVAIQVIRDGTETDVQRTTLPDKATGTQLSSVRSALTLAMNDYHRVGGPVEVMATALGRLADAGRAFYRALFGDAASPVAALPARTVVQIAPLSGRLGVPWEVVYERPFAGSPRHGARLCESFLDHGPEPDDCPNKEATDVVCPHGFWGYRYVIEQLPGHVDPRITHVRRELDGVIANSDQLSVAAIVSNRLTGVDSHLERLEGLATRPRFELNRIDSAEKAKGAMGAPGSAAHVLYFYTHGGKTDTQLPFLEVGEFPMTSNSLDAWRVRFLVGPLVFVNACESAAYAPEDFEDLLSDMLNRGAIGAVATQCDVKEPLADDIAAEFFRRLLRKTSAGESLYEARHALLRRYDPRGLAYSLFASADVALAQAVV